MKQRILILVFVLFSSGLATAQSKYTISGFVRDTLSSEPLVGVAVIASPTNGTLTNEYGFYSLIVNDGETKLTFSHIGYSDKKYKTKIERDLELNILLTSSYLEIGEVFVLVKKRAVVKVRPLGNYSVDAKQLDYIPSFMGEKDILKYFQLLPGVNGGKEASSGMNIRGGSTDQTLILMDDIPIYNSSHAFGYTSIFNGNYIKSAELYKGYIPSKYGGRLSGVATMNIRDGDKNEHKQQLQIGTTTASAVVEGPIDSGKGSYLIGGRYFIPTLFLEGMRIFANKDISSSHTSFGFYDATAKISYDVSKNSTLHASFYTGFDAMKFNTNTVDVFNDSEDTYYSEAKEVIRWGNMVGSIRLSSKLNDRSFFNVTAYYSHLSNIMDNTDTDSDGESLGSTTSSQMGEAGLKFDFNHNINSWYRLSYGLNASYQHFTPQSIVNEKNSVVTSVDYGNRTLYTASTYIENIFRLGDFTLNVGGRLALYNNNNENKVVFEPRTALTYYMPKSSVWLSYTVNTQPLFSITQTTTSFPLDYWVPFQNGDELSSNQQLSLGYKHSFDIGLDIQLETYYKKTDNLSVVYNVADFLLSDGGYTIGTGDAYGAEFLAQYGYDRFNVMLAYTYSRSIHNIDGKSVNFMFDTPHNLNILASYETLVKGVKRHTLSANANFKTGICHILCQVQLYL